MKLKELPLDLRDDAETLIRLSIQEFRNEDPALFRHYETIVIAAEERMEKRGWHFTWVSAIGPRFWPIE